MKIKAAVASEIHKKINLQSFEIEDPLADEVIVKLEYAAINHRDIYITQGLYANIQLPCILGSDGSGKIIKKGTNVSQFNIGDEVITQPGIDWGNDEKFQSKNFQIIGMPSNGTFAEAIKINAEQIFPKPLHLNAEQAAALPLAGLTAYRALVTRGKVKQNDKVLVTGAGGGVALFVIQFALALGCEVWVTSGKQDKIDKCIALGAKGGVNYKEENWHKTLLKNVGEFDVIVDAACGKDFGKLTDICKPGGTICVYGGTAGKIGDIQPGKIFWKQINICGSTMGTPKEFEEMLDLVNTQKIVPITEKVFNLENINEAIDYIENANQFGKVLLKIG